MINLNLDSTKKKQMSMRVVIYLFGMVLLALGITLNTQAGLGASAIVSVPYTISQGTGMNFANLTLIAYCVLVVAQFFIKGKNRRWIDALQVVVSILFTRFMALFPSVDYQTPTQLPTNKPHKKHQSNSCRIPVPC